MSNSRNDFFEWKDLRDDGKYKWEGLLIGNGGSIALHEGFGYTSLYDEAVKTGRLAVSQPLFEKVGDKVTTNFEQILQLLHYGIIAQELLEGDASKMRVAHDEIRTALIWAVKETHCDRKSVEERLRFVSKFVQKFRTVVTFNYDLTLYWAILAANNEIGVWFKDCFIERGQFRDDWSSLRKPLRADGTTLLFYGHGNLILARDKFGEEIKIAAEGGDLLSKITSKWENEGYSPLFITEGTAPQKLKAIRRSKYLSIVYNEVLTSFEGKDVVVYGLSFQRNDRHILEALKKGPPKTVAVSIYRPDTNDAKPQMDKIRIEIKEYCPNTAVVFFDASDEGCWCHPEK